MALMLGVSSYLLYVRTGHTPWSLLGIQSWGDLANRSVPRVNIQQLEQQVERQLDSLTTTATSVLPESLPVLSNTQPQQIYRWVDKQGVTHFGENPPAGVGAEKVVLQPDRNVIQGYAAEPESATEASAEDIQRMMNDISRERAEALDKAGE